VINSAHSVSTACATRDARPQHPFGTYSGSLWYFRLCSLLMRYLRKWLSPSKVSTLLVFPSIQEVLMIINSFFFRWKSTGCVFLMGNLNLLITSVWNRLLMNQLILVSCNWWTLSPSCTIYNIRLRYASSNSIGTYSYFQIGVDEFCTQNFIGKNLCWNEFETPRVISFSA